MDPFSIIIPIIYIILGLTLVWLVAELVITIRKVRGRAMEMMDEVDPIIKKVDPMMDRAQLTIDSVNLELIRADSILEDVGKITNSAARATNAVESITSAPVDVVSTVTDKIIGFVSPKKASAASTKAGLKGSDDKNPYAELVGATIDAAATAVRDQREERKEAAAENAAEHDAAAEKMNETSSTIANAVLDKITESADDEADSKASKGMHAAKADLSPEQKKEVADVAAAFDVKESDVEVKPEK